MNERYWEINGNLYDEQYGLKNIKDFEEVIISVKNLYDQLFGEEVMINSFCFLFIFWTG